MENWSREDIDLVTLVATILLLLIGVVSVYSATYDAGASVVFYRQLLWIGLGCIAMLVVMLTPFRSLQMLSYIFYALSLIALVGVLAAGKMVSGSKSWFGVRGLGLQPSEFAKAATVLALASFLSNRHVNVNRLKDIGKAVLLAGVPALLILMEPDLGTAVIFFGMLLVIMYWAGTSNFFLLTVLAPAAAAIASLFGTTPFVLVILLSLALLLILRENRFASAIVFSLTVLVGVSVQFMFGKLAPYQQKRIITFMNPDADPLGAGYNVLQSKIAIGSGGLLGKGFLQGTQTQLNFIPAQWTDFIYCVPSEEFGFIGAFLILFLLTVLLYRGVQIAGSVKSSYASFVAIGIVATFAVHVLINIGMAMGMVPVIGVPLPFLSYGGSNLITNMMMIGLLLNMHANRKEY